VQLITEFIRRIFHYRAAVTFH